MKYQKKHETSKSNIFRPVIIVVCLTVSILIVYGILNSGIGALGGILDGDAESASSNKSSEISHSSLPSKPPVSSSSSSSSSSPSSSDASADSSSSTATSSVPEATSSAISKPPADPNDAFPGLYVDKPDYIPHKKGDKVVYLTFDDGPSCYTLPLLDVLDQYNIKATFFVVGKSAPEDITALKETVKRGHTLAVHSYSHQYQDIYQSPDAYLADFQRQRDLIHDTTGVEPTIYRYPGGSINGYNKNTYKKIITEMNRRGYTYYDWNVDSGDATGNNIPADTIYNNVMNGVSGKEKAIVLLHNTSAKKTTLDVMPRLIESLLKQGYRFEKLDNTVEPTNFGWR